MKQLFLICLLAIAGITAEAQVRVRVGPGYGYGRPRARVRMNYRQPRPPRQQPQQRRRDKLPAFEPSVNLNFGYGFPNLDKDHFANFSNLYKGNITNQTGPFTGSVDYQFSRFMSIGVMGTYGKVNQPYYNYTNNSSTSSTADLTGKYENWSLMLNVVTYLPTRSRAVSPYLRTALGINNWKQEYADPSGVKTEGLPEPTAFAYQASLGAKFNLSKRAGIFLEAGYGKYIVSGGLALKF